MNYKKPKENVPFSSRAQRDESIVIDFKAAKHEVDSQTLRVGKTIAPYNENEWLSACPERVREEANLVTGLTGISPRRLSSASIAYFMGSQTIRDEHYLPTYGSTLAARPERHSRW